MVSIIIYYSNCQPIVQSYVKIWNATIQIQIFSFIETDEYDIADRTKRMLFDHVLPIPIQTKLVWSFDSCNPCNSNHFLIFSGLCHLLHFAHFGKYSFHFVDESGDSLTVALLRGGCLRAEHLWSPVSS